MIPRDCQPIGHIPPLRRIDLNAPRPVAQAAMKQQHDNNPFHNPAMEAMAQGRRKAELDRIWKLIEQFSEHA